MTSADPDHTGGNERVSSAGTYVRLLDTFDPRGANKNASIIAHVNVLERMSGPSGTKAPTPAGAWPSDTYFTNDWALFVNDEAIELVHIPAAHTDGDTMAFFRRSDVISTGDIFTTTGYPRFDPEHGGSVTGILDGLNRILEIAIPGENQTGGTAIVPGHGRISDETEVANYRDMVTIVRDRVAALIGAGHDARAGAGREAVERLRRNLRGSRGPDTGRVRRRDLSRAEGSQAMSALVPRAALLAAACADGQLRSCPAPAPSAPSRLLLRRTNAPRASAHPSISRASGWR